jgi:gliding motility-associated-like protein
MGRWILNFLLVFAAWFPQQAMAHHDTLYVCRVGDTIRLNTDSNYMAYSWLPNGSLDNPTIYNPLATPTRTTTYVVRAVSSLGSNLIVNSDFTQGNTGFTSRYRFEPTTISSQGTYGVTNNPARLNSASFAPCGDHTTGTGNMMIVDGSPQAREEVWCQTVRVEANKKYAFSMWLTSVNSINPAALQFSINGVQLGEVFNATRTLCDWRQFYETWQSQAATEANICIINQNINRTGNDFALDDFAFFELADEVYDTVTVIVIGQKVTVIDTAICDGSFIAFQNTRIPPNSNPRFTLTSSEGCDSLVIWRVGLLDTIFESLRVDTLCPGEVLPFFDLLLTRDTTVCRTFAVSNSCDSTFCVTAVFLTETALTTTAQAPTCAGLSDGSIAILPVAGVPPYRFAWNTGDSTATLARRAAETYQVTVTDAKGCRAEKIIELEEPPLLRHQINAASRWCNGKVLGQIFLDAIGGTPPYRYSLDAGTTFLSSPVAQPLGVGRYAVWLQDDNGCVKTATIGIPEPTQSELLVFAPSLVVFGDSVLVELLDNAPSPLTYEWQPTTGVACPDCPTTHVQPLRSTEYLITGTDSLGCQLRATWQVNVQQTEQLFLPSAFSPNADGINDTFEPFAGKGIAAIESLLLFDRWGNLVFEGRQCLTSPQACTWDGRFKGILQATGNYTYFATVTYLDGRQVVVKGSLLLME